PQCNFWILMDKQRYSKRIPSGAKFGHGINFVRLPNYIPFLFGPVRSYHFYGPDKGKGDKYPQGHRSLRNANNLPLVQRFHETRFIISVNRRTHNLVRITPMAYEISLSH